MCSPGLVNVRGASWTAALQMPEQQKLQLILLALTISWFTQQRVCVHITGQTLAILVIMLLGPFHGAIAVPSVTRCHCRRCNRRRCRGHQCAGGARQYR